MPFRLYSCGCYLAIADNYLEVFFAHVEDALAFCRDGGYRLELDWTCCDYSDMLRDLDGEGGRPKAMSLLDESLSGAGEGACGA